MDQARETGGRNNVICRPLERARNHFVGLLPSTEVRLLSEVRCADEKTTSLRLGLLPGDSVTPVVWFATMVLNRDDYDHVASCFVDDAVRKSVNLATARALRKRRPGFRIVSDTRDGFFDFVRKLET
jgi:hypothetical protein